MGGAFMVGVGSLHGRHWMFDRRGPATQHVAPEGRAARNNSTRRLCRTEPYPPAERAFLDAVQAMMVRGGSSGATQFTACTALHNAAVGSCMPPNALGSSCCSPSCGYACRRALSGRMLGTTAAPVLPHSTCTCTTQPRSR